MLSDLQTEALRKYGGLDLAHKAMMIQDARAVLAMDRKQTRELNLLAATGEAEIDEEDDDMPGDIIIGDQYHTTPAATSKLSPLLKLAVAGALLASGAGVGAAVPIVLDLLADKPAQEVREVQDSDTKYEFDLPDAE